MAAVQIALFAVFVYNVYLALRAVIYMFRSRSYGEGIFSFLFFIIAPLFVYGVALLPAGNVKIWAGTFAVVLLAIWICWGFILDANRKKRLSGGIIENKMREAPARIALLKVLSLLIISALVWCYGAFIGINDLTARNIVLGLDALAFYSAVIRLWKWRSWITKPTKER